MITLYGLKNCDTCRKALKWLQAEDIEHRFHDVRADGLNAAMMDQWIKSVGWETLLNTRGTTWRKLDEGDKADMDETRAARLMVNQPALVKRPVVEIGERIIVGFKDAQQGEISKLLD